MTRGRAAEIRSRRRAGSVYLLVLATSAMVAVLGVSGLLAARLVRASEALGADAASAEHLAAAGLAAAANRLGRNEVWAADPGPGWSPPVALGEGVYRTRVQADPDAPGLHRVRVRAAVGDAVRVLEATLREPPRRGPELLPDPGFHAGLHPGRVRGDREVHARLEREAGLVHVDLSRRSGPRDGIEVDVPGGLDADARYEVSARVRQPAGNDAVRLGLEAGGTLRTAVVAPPAWTGPGWVVVSDTLTPPAAAAGGPRRVFLDTDRRREDLLVEWLSLRRVLPPATASLVPGSLAPVPDDPTDRGLDVRAAPADPGAAAAAAE